VRREKPDLVFVQECDPGCEAALRQELADTLPHRVAVSGGGSAGSVILSRHPLRDADPVPGTMGMPAAVADVGGWPGRLQHAPPMPPRPGQTDPWQRDLGRRGAAAARGRTTPAVWAGDFNCSQDNAAFRSILDTGLHDGARLTGSDRTP